MISEKTHCIVHLLYYRYVVGVAAQKLRRLHHLRFHFHNIHGRDHLKNTDEILYIILIRYLRHFSKRYKKLLVEMKIPLGGRRGVPCIAEALTYHHLYISGGYNNSTDDVILSMCI